MPEEVKKKPVLPKKPDEISHPDPLKRFKALKEWRKVVNKITGEEDIMKWEPKKTFPEADKVADKTKKVIQEETEATKKEVEVKKIGKVKKKRTLAEQLAELKRIRKNKKRLKDKEAQEKKKKKIG